MHQGHPEYGVVVKAEKSLANFDIVLHPDHKIAKPDSDISFPFCGILIDTGTLDVERNREGKGSKSPISWPLNTALTIDRHGRFADSGHDQDARADIPPQSIKVSQ
ncbi:hypothetical protein BU16DRAFT_524196 [Lophium mytilinum]|uniref:Uncharacterized protein n=1 Tax=Lophium mytilinum TaxID=390894 RepID=A0A6A6R599_9PEZI|nr:hypothetical protein BU16DRAFT_524196 [Lophium mytilinum]